jgi:outer membrane protein OmpA-like peptidoglycan-associated protein
MFGSKLEGSVMIHKLLKTVLIVCVFSFAAAAASANTVELQSIEFPVKQPVHVWFATTDAAPTTRVTADVTYNKGQAKIDLTYDDMKPAILFGGDVSCYVLWAVTRDGQVENLGEFLTRKLDGRLSFSTGKKKFAMMVTAESFYLVGRPSDLVVLYNRGTAAEVAASSAFQFAEFVDAPRHNMEAVAHIKWDSDVPLELLQARKAFELATRNESEVHAPEIYSEARKALDSANEIAASSPRSRELLDSARRAVALSTEAINISLHRIEAMELEAAVAAQRQETADLERRAAEAEVTAREAQALSERVRAEAEAMRAERDRMTAETTALKNEKVELESSMLALSTEKSDLQSESERLRREKADLEVEKNALEAEAIRLALEKSAVEADAARLQQEKDDIDNRLQSALSHVADTQESIRGYVVNLPDILFDVNEATLKPEAREVMAKLAGILLIMRDQSVVIEGHTDSTGSPEYNLDLSRRRATAVSDFLRAHGLDAERLQAVGFGMERSIAENTTPEGRKRNRRVEVVISETVETVAAEVAPQAATHVQQ